MFVIIGSVMVMVCVFGGYMIGHGTFGVFLHPGEYIVILGMAIGALVVSAPLPQIKAVIAGVIHTLKGSSVKKADYIELLKMMYDFFQLMRREGALAGEAIIEDPKNSPLMQKYPKFLSNHHAVDFMCDTLRVGIAGNVEPHDLEALADMDMETMHEEEHKAPMLIQKVGDSLPGIGIVAAVLGIIITMGAIAEGPEKVGMSVAAALVGTFLGIFVSYGFIQPLATNLEIIQAAEHKYLACIKAGVISFLKNHPPLVSVEYARRSIYMADRPSFKEIEPLLKAK